MIKSQYNIVVENEGNYCIFNTFTGAICRLDQSTWNRYCSDNLTMQEEDALARRGFLVHDSSSQISIINADRINGIRDQQHKCFRIWTTTACNARCFYCFERGIDNKSMDHLTAQQVARYICSTLHRNDSVAIEWFGGEPLMNTEPISIITNIVARHCETIGALYKAYIITNGSLINDGIAHDMKEKWHIKLAQITLDGFSDCYNMIKCYSNPLAHNFYTVIHNIHLLTHAGISVSIRMNYTEDNYKTLVNLISYLKKEFDGNNLIHYYVYPIWSGLYENDSTAYNSCVQADGHFVNLLTELVDYGMAKPRFLFRMVYKRRQCGSCRVDNCAILPDGVLLKCSEAMNSPIGDIWHGITNKQTEHIWLDEGLDPKCTRCPYLPLCQGGCRSSKVTRTPQCNAFKPIYKELIRWYINNYTK